MWSGVCTGSFGRGRWFPGCGREPDFHMSVLVDVIHRNESPYLKDPRIPSTQVPASLERASSSLGD